MTGVWTRRSSIELTARAPGEIRTPTLQVRSLAQLSVVLPERSTRTSSRTWASALSRRCSATELHGSRDAYGIRTRTLHLDRVAHWPVVLRRHSSGAGTRTPITRLTAVGPAIRRHRNKHRALPSCGPSARPAFVAGAGVAPALPGLWAQRVPVTPPRGTADANRTRDGRIESPATHAIRVTAAQWLVRDLNPHYPRLKRRDDMVA